MGASMAAPSAWTPGRQCSAGFDLPADNVFADSGYVRKDIDPPQA